MSSLTPPQRRDGAAEMLITSGLLVLYVGLRGTSRALGVLESVVVR